MTSTRAKARCIKCEDIKPTIRGNHSPTRCAATGAVKEKNSQVQSLIASIAQWEQKSIEKIRQKVVQLDNTDQKNAISEELENLTKQIQIAREDDDFFVTELQHWTSILEKVSHQRQNIALSTDVKEDNTMPLTYQIQIVSSPLKMISSPAGDKIEAIYEQIEYDTVVSDEKFDRCHGNAKIEQHGLLVTNGRDSFFGTEIRGKKEYSSGVHNLRLRIENNPSKIWIFIGIISKEARMGENLFASSSVYGWGDCSGPFLAGERQKPNSEVVFTHTHENDVIELIIDCARRRIQHKNERNQASEELTIDMNKCSFPWQL